MAMITDIWLRRKWLRALTISKLSAARLSSWGGRLERGWPLRWWDGSEAQKPLHMTYLIHGIECITTYILTKLPTADVDRLHHNYLWYSAGTVLFSKTNLNPKSPSNPSTSWDSSLLLRGLILAPLSRCMCVRRYRSRPCWRWKWIWLRRPGGGSACGLSLTMPGSGRSCWSRGSTIFLVYNYSIWLSVTKIISYTYDMVISTKWIFHNCNIYQKFIIIIIIYTGWYNRIIYLWYGHTYYTNISQL
jgi:hypothetical protein